MEPIIGELERRDIRDNVRKVLRDLGNPQPPLSLPDVRQLLELDLRYYDGSDDGLFAELAHRARLVTKKTLPDLGRRLRDAVEKAKLLAFWVPETKRVLIDSRVPKPKHRWIEGHEIIHRITTWHRYFLFGDDGQTLNPHFHAML